MLSRFTKLIKEVVSEISRAHYLDITKDDMFNAYAHAAPREHRTAPPQGLKEKLVSCPKISPFLSEFRISPKHYGLVKDAPYLLHQLFCLKSIRSSLLLNMILYHRQNPSGNERTQKSASMHLLLQVQVVYQRHTTTSSKTITPLVRSTETRIEMRPAENVD